MSAAVAAGRRVLPRGYADFARQLLIWFGFVFAYQVYSKPDFGLAASPPLNLMAGVAAPDARTVAIHWKQTYPDADGSGGDTQIQSVLSPLPSSRPLTTCSKMAPSTRTSAQTTSTNAPKASASCNSSTA